MEKVNAQTSDLEVSKSNVDAIASDANDSVDGRKLAAKTNSESPGMVDKSRLDHALSDMHRFKDENKKLKDQLESNERERLKSLNDYKTLAEMNESKYKEADTRANKLLQATVYDRKIHAVIGAMRSKGLKKEAELDVENLDLSEVQFETTSTGRINILNADEFADRQKTIRPHWFGSSAQRVNSNSPDVNGSGKLITVDEISKAYEKGNKSGDLSDYYAKHKQYVKQTQGS
jgi:hypothetical protein